MKIKTIIKRMAGLLTVFMVSACGTHASTTPDPNWLQLPQDIVAEAVDYRNDKELNISIRYNNAILGKYGSDAKYSIHYENTYLLEKAKEIFEEQYPGWVVCIQPEGMIEVENPNRGDWYLTYDYSAEERYYHELPDRIKKSKHGRA